MPTKNRDGRFIISASEVSSYVLCPMAWKLALDKRHKTSTEREIVGNQVHEKWAKDVDDLYFLTRTIRIVVTSIAAAIVLWLFMQKGN